MPILATFSITWMPSSWRDGPRKPFPVVLGAISACSLVAGGLPRVMRDTDSKLPLHGFHCGSLLSVSRISPVGNAKWRRYVNICSERNSQLLCNPFVSQRLTRVLKPSKRPLPTTFLPKKAYFQSDRIFPLSFQRLSRASYRYRRNLKPIRRTNFTKYFQLLFSQKI